LLINIINNIFGTTEPSSCCFIYARDDDSSCIPGALLIERSDAAGCAVWGKATRPDATTLLGHFIVFFAKQKLRKL
jgi:hypothetical protein